MRIREFRRNSIVFAKPALVLLFLHCHSCRKCEKIIEIFARIYFSCRARDASRTTKRMESRFSGV
jgi:hypothetical protein